MTSGKVGFFLYIDFSSSLLLGFPSGTGLFLWKAEMVPCQWLHFSHQRFLLLFKEHCPSFHNIGSGRAFPLDQNVPLLPDPVLQ